MFYWLKTYFNNVNAFNVYCCISSKYHCETFFIKLFFLFIGVSHVLVFHSNIP